MSSTSDNVAALCRALDRKVTEYGEVVKARAEAEAEYKSERAKRKLRARADGAKSVAESEDIADADEQIKALHLDHLITAGSADALRTAIKALLTRIEYGRSEMSTEREQDKLHSLSLAGQA